MARRKPPAASASVALAQAHRLWSEHRYDEALRLFGEAARLAPNDIKALFEASRAFALRFEAQRSARLVERALRLGPRRFEVQYAAGETYQLLGQMGDAEACFRRACRLANDPASQLELARICERRHALDEAESLIDRVIEVQPRSFAALLLRARVARRRGQSEKALSTLEQLTATAPRLANPSMAAEAYGELCTLLDSMGRYDEAWSAIIACKGVLRPHEKNSWEAAQFILARAGRMIESLSPADFDRWRNAPLAKSSQRLALLTGFPRSGTTLLEQVLDAHPEAVSLEEKEVFSGVIFPWLGEGRPADFSILQILDELAPERGLAARQRYLALMQGMLSGPLAGRLLVDKNPAMTMMIPPMRRLFPELKLIVALRDPRDVVLSCFLRYLPVNPVSAWFLTLERTAERYALDLGAWLKMREMIDDWVEVRYEDLVDDLPREAKRTLSALGLPWDDSVLNYRQLAEQKRVLSPTYEAVAKPVFNTSLGRWRNYERHLARVLDRLAPLAAALGYES
jgi:tetratricopeptide (TPR) repeat protein